jgi:hypothetical protein
MSGHRVWYAGQGFWLLLCPDFPVACLLIGQVFSLDSRKKVNIPLDIAFLRIGRRVAEYFEINYVQYPMRKTGAP